ncbi:MAG: rhodanese-like domain-containing protein [Phycisphaerales bacterium]
MTTIQENRTSTSKELDPHAVSRLIAEGKAYLIDVREPDERKQRRITGSISMPLGVFDPASISARPGAFPIFHCRAGGRSQKALERFLAASTLPAAHMKGGIDAWRAAGLPVVEQPGFSLTAMQQTQILMGAIVLIGIALGVLWTPWALGLSAFIGCGMIFAGITGNCAMANVLATMPWNRSKSCSGACSV